MSIIGAIVGPLSETVYFRDYWMPQSVFAIRIGSFPFMLEDVLFGFAIVGIAGVIYEVVARTREVKSRRTASAKYSSLQILAIFVVALGLGLSIGINSIYASAIAFVATAVPMLWLRRDLLRDAIGSGFGLVLTMFVCYLCVFTLTSNIHSLMQEGWLLYGTRLDLRVVGIPLTEMVWAFTMGFLAGPLYEFLNNKRLV